MLPSSLVVGEQPRYPISFGKQRGDLMPFPPNMPTQARSREDVTGTGGEGGIPMVKIWNLEMDGYPGSCIFDGFRLKMHSSLFTYRCYRL